jgi:hypothetical protein
MKYCPHCKKKLKLSAAEWAKIRRGNEAKTKESRKTRDFSPPPQEVIDECPFELVRNADVVDFLQEALDIEL